jgi:tetratricopeptide (TPR) repeat protein
MEGAGGIPYRLLWLAAAAMIAGVAACAPTAVTPGQAVKAMDYQAAISHLEADDPQSPEALNARLAYADYLSHPAENAQNAPGADDCRQRAATAQSQLDIVAGTPAIHVLLPLGPARIAGGEYRIHLARAGCGGASPLKSELEQALETAQQAVGLYRDALDYQSAVIMQFNVAATYQELGDVRQAVRALQAAIAMDRDFGFRKDAEANTRLLLQWQNGPAGDSDVAALMKDFPARSAEFKFHWSATDADVAVTASDSSMVRGKIIPSRGAITLKRQIRGGPTGWTVSNEPANSRYDLGDWPADDKNFQWSMMYFLTSALLQAPAIQLGGDGDFAAVPNSQAFGTSLAAEVSAEISARIGDIASTDAPPSRPGDAVMRDLTPAFSPDFIESSAMQDYGLVTGTWIGAKLEQGVWYQMTTPLFLPGLGLGHYLAQYDIDFAYTRQVPCEAQAPDRLCAEIVVHATPDADALKGTLEDVAHRIKMPDKQALHYWSTTDLRLVIDPDTLLPYMSDRRQYWYYALAGLGKSEPVIDAMRTVSRFAYQ